MLHVSQQIGGAIGVALLSSIYVLRSTSHADAARDGLLAGLERASAAAAVLFAILTVIALPHRKLTPWSSNGTAPPANCWWETTWARPSTVPGRPVG